MALRGGYSSLVAGLVAIALSTVAAASEQPSSSEPPSRIIVRAQPLSAALARFAELTDLPIYAPTRLLRGRMSSPVAGAFSPESALQALLADTGLEAVRTPNGTYVIQEAVVREADPVRTKPEPDRASGEPEEMDLVQVLGTFTGGLDRSIAVKRDADTIVDAIVAAEIGRLPAVNVAEALQRVPGMTITREAGEGQFVGSRGLGPIFQAVTLNGLPVAVNENIRNSDQSGRQFRFRVLPADLISGVVVTKAPTADQVEGGIGSTIDIVIAEPLDAAPFASGRIFTSYDQRVGEPTPNGAISAAWSNDQNGLGVLAGLSYQERRVQFDRLQNFGYETYNLPGFGAVETPNNWVMTVEEEQRRRMSSVGAVQWRPTDTLQILAEGFYSEFNNTIAENRLSYEIGPQLESGLVPGSARIENGVLYGAEIANGAIIKSAEYSEQTHRNTSVRLRADRDIGPWRVSPRVSWSQARSRLDLPLQRISAETPEDSGVRYRFDLGASPVDDGQIAGLISELDLMQPGSTQFKTYLIRPISSVDEDSSVFLDVSRTLDWDEAGLNFQTLRFGAQATSRSREYERRDRLVSLKPGYQVGQDFFRYAVPDDAMAGLIAQRNGWIGPDLGLFRQAFEVPGEYPGVTAQPEDLAPTSDDLRQSYRIEEEIEALYGRIDFETGWLGWPVEGNFGVRWAQTRTEVHGALVAGADGSGGEMEIVASPRVTESRYENWLPSLNLAIHLSENQVLRLSASRSMTRPSLASLRDSTVPSSATLRAIYERGAEALSEPYLNLRAVGGNPELDPFVSTNLDASFEQYFEPFGLASVSVFHKRINNYISGEYRPETFVFRTRDGDAVPVELNVNRPQNIGEVRISGLELGYSRQLRSGWGLSASAALTQSDIEPMHSDRPLDMARLLGVSEVSYSITPFFQRDRVEAHLSYTWRSEYGVNGNVTIASGVITGGEDQIVSAGFGTLDFGLSFQLSDRVELFAEGGNLTDAHQAAYQGTPDKPYQVHQYGTTYNAGLRARF